MADLTATEPNKTTESAPQPAAEQRLSDDEVELLAGSDDNEGAEDGGDEQAETNSDDTELTSEQRLQSQYESQDAENGSRDVNYGATNTVETKVGAKKKIKPLQNVLHDYATYTYNLSLHLLDATAYNKLIGKPLVLENQRTNGANVLIASAGRRNEVEYDFKRNKWFGDDFYFENFKMQTVMGLNARTKGTNAVSMDFTIIEPYGISLLDRLIQACKDLGIDNYIATPYLLVIDFFGYKDSDHNPSNAIKLCQRKIPIRLLNMTTNFDQKGTVYQFSAVPYGHLAFTESNVSLPTNVRIKTSNGTIGEFFSSTEAEIGQILSSVPSAVDEKKEAAIQRAIKAKETESPGTAVTEETKQNIRQRIEKQFSGSLQFATAVSATGLGSILESYNKFLAEKYKLSPQPASYLFEFDDDRIKDSVINDGAGNRKHASAPMAAPSSNAPATASNQPANEGSITSATFGELQSREIYGSNIAREISFNQGTSIIEVINSIMKASSFIQDQLKEATDEAASDEQKAEIEKKFNFYEHFKIVPEVVLLGYDKKRKDYAKIIKFTIKPYKFNGIRYPYINRDTRPEEVDCVKEYNYLFTGKNSDIIDLKINFDAMFFTSLTAALDRHQEEGKQANKQSDSALTDDGEEILPAALIFQPSIPGGNNLTQESVEAQRANDLFGNLYTRSQADMLGISMDIVGDPAYLQQEEFTIMANVPRDSVASDVDSRLTADGSLFMNDNNLLVKLNFKLPTDINTETTGLYEYGETGLRKDSMFTGIYKILTVEHVFERGLFTQKLDMIRVHNDPSANKRVAKKPSVEAVREKPTEVQTAASPAAATVIVPPLTRTLAENPAPPGDINPETERPIGAVTGIGDSTAKDRAAARRAQQELNRAEQRRLAEQSRQNQAPAEPVTNISQITGA